jgi:hypothetical protein
MRARIRPTCDTLASLYERGRRTKDKLHPRNRNGDLIQVLVDEQMAFSAVARPMLSI